MLSWWVQDPFLLPFRYNLKRIPFILSFIFGFQILQNVNERWYQAARKSSIEEKLLNCLIGWNQWQNWVIFSNPCSCLRMFSIVIFHILWIRIKNGQGNALKKVSAESFSYSVSPAADTRYRDRHFQVFQCRWLNDITRMALCRMNFHKGSSHNFWKKSLLSEKFQMRLLWRNCHTGLET